MAYALASQPRTPYEAALNREATADEERDLADSIRRSVRALSVDVLPPEPPVARDP